MGQYLEKFKGIIGKVQTKQVLKLLNQQRNTGQVRSVKEFSKKLETLIRELTSTGLTPSLKLYRAEPNTKIDSESYNFMLDRVEDDLDSAFQEANQIDEVQQAHEAIVRDVLLKKLKNGVAELKAKIDTYKFIAQSGSGYDRALYSTFNEAKGNRTFRGQEKATVVFEDPRTKLLIPFGEAAEVELSGERLVLPAENKTYRTIKNVRQIYDASTPQSELIVEPSWSKILNIGDNQKGTYWVQVLLTSVKRTSVKTKIEIDLGAVKEINFLNIEPAIKQKVILESVHYRETNGIFTSLGLDEIIVEGNFEIKIPQTSTDKFIFTFRDDNPTRAHFEYSPNTDELIFQALDEPPETYVPSIAQVSEALNDIISSSDIRDIIGVQTITKSTFDGYAFLMGIDNIRVGSSTFKTRGSYVSLPMEGNNISSLGLKTVEKRPYKALGVPITYTNITYDLDTAVNLSGTGYFSNPDDVFFLCSIEYWVTKLDYDKNGILKQINTFPMLPLETQRIYHERLPLTEKSSSIAILNDIGYTMFLTDVDIGNLKVYRNGNLTVQDNDWELISDAALTTPLSGERMKTKIKILSQSLGDIFTVSYSPFTSTTRSVPSSLNQVVTQSGLLVVDLTGDLDARLVDEKEVVIGYDTIDKENWSTKLFLSIILRRNTSESSVTSAVEEYTLFGGQRNNSKFEE